MSQLNPFLGCIDMLVRAVPYVLNAGLEAVEDHHAIIDLCDRLQCTRDEAIWLVVQAQRAGMRVYETGELRVPAAAESAGEERT